MLSIALILALASPSAAQALDGGADEPLPLGVEGPLQNDVFLGADPDATAALARGDELLAQSRAARLDAIAARNADRLLTEAFEAWLAVSPAGDADALAWHPLERGPDRRRVAEDAGVALAAAVGALEPPEAARWRAHVDREAAEARRRSGNAPEELRAIEAIYPGTAHAASAALALADRAIAAGRLGDARGWVRRARAHVAPADDPALGAGLGAGLGPALDLRATWLAERTAGAPVAAPLAAGSRLVHLGAVALPDPQAEFYAGRGLPVPGPGRGMRSGGARLDDGRVAVQSASRVHLVALDGRGPRVEAAFSPAELVATGLDRPPDATRADGSPGWPLLPATDGRRLVVVQGRAEVVQAFGIEETAPNALVCVTPPPPDPGPRTVDPLPELEWAVLGARRLDREGAVHALDAAAPLATLELQPGPVIVGDTVVVTARSVQGELAAWLLAFDLADGELRWARQLAQGADLAAEGSRFRFGRPRRPAAQPPIAVGALVFAGTHLGSGHLVDPLDGRIVWSVAARRRAPSVAGWAGARPAVRALPDGGHEVLWAPADSDRLYALRVDGGALPRGAAGGSARATDALFAAVQAIGEARAVLGAAPDGIVLQGRAGRERAVFRRSRDGAQRTDAVYLGREEEFRSVGSAAGARAIACSDRGLYLFDLERDLALLDYAWLGPTGPDQPRATARDTGLGGELLVDGERVWVVGNGAAWAFRVAP